MDVKIILDTAKQFLVTPPGQKLLKKINIEQVDKVIEAIRAADEEGKFDKSTKNAQERKTERGIHSYWQNTYARVSYAGVS